MPAKAYDVFLNGKEIDTVFYTDSTVDDVKRSLVDRDGYNPGIVVKKATGRPPKYGQPTVRVSVRLPADIAAAIDSVAVGMFNPRGRSECIVDILRAWKEQTAEDSAPRICRPASIDPL
mgnify:CR=1 FL=1